MPITEAEANSLIQQGSSLDEISLNALGRGRCCLWRDHPKDEPPRVFWGAAFLLAYTIEGDRARAYFCCLAAGASRGQGRRALRDLGAESPPNNSFNRSAN
jgi:hypothetical protein